LPPAPTYLPPAPALSQGEATTQPGWLGRAALPTGLGIGFAAFVITYAVFAGSSGGANDEGYAALGIFVGSLLVTPIVLTAGIVLTVIQRTRMFGTGLLISLALGILSGAGVCVVLLQSA
jgi:hypothetical protein